MKEDDTTNQNTRAILIAILETLARLIEKTDEDARKSAQIVRDFISLL